MVVGLARVSGRANVGAVGAERPKADCNEVPPGGATWASQVPSSDWPLVGNVSWPKPTVWAAQSSAQPQAQIDTRLICNFLLNRCRVCGTRGGEYATTDRMTMLRASEPDPNYLIPETLDRVWVGGSPHTSGTLTQRFSCVVSQSAPRTGSSSVHSNTTTARASCGSTGPVYASRASPADPLGFVEATRADCESRTVSAATLARQHIR